MVEAFDLSPGSLPTVTDGLSSASIGADLTSFSAGRGSQFLIAALHENCTDPDNVSAVTFDDGGAFASVPMSRLEHSGLGPGSDYVALYGLFLGDYWGSGTISVAYASSAHNGSLRSIAGSNVNPSVPTWPATPRVGTYPTTPTQNTGGFTVNAEANDVVLGFVSWTTGARTLSSNSSVLYNVTGSTVRHLSDVNSISIPGLYGPVRTWGGISGTPTWASLVIVVRDVYNAAPGFVPYPMDVTDLLLNNAR